MKCSRWLLVALVACVLGCILLPATSSAEDRTAQALWGESNNSAMGDPDTGGGSYTGSNYLDGFRLIPQRKAGRGEMSRRSYTRHQLQALFWFQITARL